MPEHPDARRENDEAFVRARSSGARALRRRQDGLHRKLLDGRSTTRHRVERRVHVSVLRFGGAAKRLGLAEVADDRMRAARRDARGLLVVAHERRHVVTAAKQRVEHRRADVAGRTGKKNAHGLRSLLCRSGFHHNSDVPRDTLIDFFDDLARARGEFLVHDDGFRTRRYTYAQVARAARAFSARLALLGLRKGDKVVFWCENRPEWIVAFWGCLLGGVIVVPVDYRASPDFLARVSAHRRRQAGRRGTGRPAARRCGDTGLEAARARLERDRPGRQRRPSTGPIARDDVAEIIFTSGATADPKGVVITHRNILANIVPVEREVLKYRKWGRPFFPLRFLNLLPLSHMFGQAMATFIPPMLPGTVIFMRGYNPVDIVGEIKTRRVSVLVSVPKILDVLREHVLRVAPEAATPGPKQHVARRWWRYRDVHRLFGLKFWSFVVGAAPLEPELEAFWGELGFVVVQGYGLTETAPIVTLNHPFGTKKGSVGKGDRRRRDEDRGRRRDSRARRERHDRLLQRGRGDRARVRRRLVPHRRHRRDRRRTASSSSAAARRK